jgi:peptidoglycan/LPS O-acetylase OafA/YrhL
MRYTTIRDLPNLDLVRSMAVISVVVEHTLLSLGILKIGPFPIKYLGVMGVMVFFVLTTLVLMWSLERKPHTLDFYIRRVFRIYPLALAAIEW